MSPAEEMKARKAAADQELKQAIEACTASLVSLTAAATDAMADLDRFAADATKLKDHAVTLKTSASVCESHLVNVMAAARRRRTCF